ncbi:hypothetical protein AVEN_42942-1 [Araneus ventricosus]|uniref:Uncharacterized protein n=1 Tax=Araneus ventricosus TaxID=182803 RepID=A0A4Y2AF86_ARAVE|nr:hypothetical protein AVEN_42942-1 [Araneus ventricosus]
MPLNNEGRSLWTRPSCAVSRATDFLECCLNFFAKSLYAVPRFASLSANDYAFEAILRCTLNISGLILSELSLSASRGTSFVSFCVLELTRGLLSSDA